MKRHRHYLPMACVLSACMLLVGCTAFIGEYGSSPYSGKDAHYFDKLTDRSREQARRDITCQLARDDELTVKNGTPETRGVALNAPLLLRFVWFSDVQIRQREVKLFSEEDSRRMDAIIPSFEHNQVQEEFDWAVYLSQIEAANTLQGVDFMIHTGDGIDAGTIEELYQFIHLTNFIRFPWLNVVGNHDVSVFGNYRDRLTYTQRAGVSFYPVGNPRNFIWMHRPERQISGFGPYLLPTPSQGGHPPSEDGRGKLASTFHHGFDLNPDMKCDASLHGSCDYDQAPGYYATDLRATPLPVRLIVLNSAKSDEWGADGRIAPAQRDWLKGRLLPAGKGINLLFMHHRPQNLDDETGKLLTDPGTSTLVAFTGHTHQHHFATVTGSVGRGVYELNTGSVLEYPQIGRVIELRGTPDGPLWLVSRALWSSFMPVREKPSKDAVESYLRECEDQRAAILDAIMRDTPQSFARAVRCAHYGAYEDYLNDRVRLVGRPQKFDEAWKEANVIVKIRD